MSTGTHLPQHPFRQADPTTLVKSDSNRFPPSFEEGGRHPPSPGLVLPLFFPRANRP